jgi:hypothetical protein
MGRCWGTIGLGQMANRWFGARAAFVKLCWVEGGDGLRPTVGHRSLAGEEGRFAPISFAKALSLR